jgi:hypothetical protein
MERRLMDLVLPRLARPLYRHLERYQSGELNETQFTQRFESLLRRQHQWLANRGVSAGRAAVAIHAAVLILSLPGLRAEAAEEQVPLEVVEHRAVCEAAADVAANYGINEQRATHAISQLVAEYGE